MCSSIDIAVIEDGDNRNYLGETALAGSSSGEETIFLTGRLQSTCQVKIID